MTVTSLQVESQITHQSSDVKDPARFFSFNPFCREPPHSAQKKLIPGASRHHLRHQSIPVHSGCDQPWYTTEQVVAHTQQKT